MKRIQNIVQTNLFKITSLNSVSVLLKIGISFITSKLIAVFVGPTGMAFVGNFRNFMTLTETTATLGFQSGVVKEVAQNQDDKEQFNSIFSTVFISLFFVSLVLSSGLFLFSDFLNTLIFGASATFSVVFKIMGLVLPFSTLSLFFISIINGLGNYKGVIYTSIIGNIIGLVFAIYMLQNYQTLGALLSVLIAPSLLFFVTLFFLNKQFSIRQSLQIGFFDFGILKKLFPYSLMAFVTAIIVPMIYLTIRKTIIVQVGVEQAGFWEAMSRISSYYLMFVVSVTSLYFLPRLSSAKSIAETKIVYALFYKSIVPMFILGVLVLFLFKYWLVELLFSKEFLPVTDLFFWQILGDIFKVSTLILGYNLIAQKRTLAFIFSELFSVAVMYFCSIYLVSIYGIKGVVIAYAASYFCYSLFLIFYFRKSLFNKVASET